MSVARVEDEVMRVEPGYGIPAAVAIMVVLRALDDEYALLVRETENKPGLKKAGTVSFPVETLHKGESAQSGLLRIHVEEIGEKAPVSIPEDPNEAYRGTVFVPHNGGHSPVDVYELQYGGLSSQANGDLRANDGEVIDHRFVPLEDIKQQAAETPALFRPGTPEVAERISNHERGFVIFPGEVDPRFVV
jgi:hypothetical protein